MSDGNRRSKLQREHDVVKAIEVTGVRQELLDSIPAKIDVVRRAPPASACLPSSGRSGLLDGVRRPRSSSCLGSHRRPLSGADQDCSRPLPLADGEACGPVPAVSACGCDESSKSFSSQVSPLCSAKSAPEPPVPFRQAVEFSRIDVESR